MKKYIEMTREEVNEILRRGGNRKTALVKEIVEFLDGLNLNEKTKNIISNSDMTSTAECFANLKTKEDIENFANEYFNED